MKVPIGWLADFIDLPTRDPYELERILVSLGHEVEGIEEFGPSFEGVVVGRVEEARPHPDADRIRFCRVDDGTATRDVVCGAWNFEAGAVIAYARAGSRLGTDTDQPLEVGSRKIRGIVSHGMFASARELGLGDDHDGIMVLNDLGAATDDDLGRPLEEVIGLGDVVLDVSITTNRGDCMGIRGLARELAAYWEIPLRDISPSFPTGPEPSAFEVSINDVEACPRFVAHQVDDVRIGPSPLWMQLRLLAIGQRPISNVVDVSNYVMWELGHPIHTFDAEAISGGKVIIRRAEEGERLETLDGVERPLAAGDILVTDPSGPIALAGVMGGASTEVSAKTTSVLVEAANWHPPSILSTSWRLGLRSEASARFERGVDPNLSALATARTVELVAMTSGGMPRSGAVDCYPIPRRPWTVDLTARDVSRLLGPAPSFGDALALLERLGFGSDRDGRSARVTVPTHRSDVTRPADLVEEIARLHGYDRFPDLVRHGSRGGLTPEQLAVRRLREALVGAGLTEAQTLSFIGQDDLDALGLPLEDPRRVTIRVKNPLREEEAILRTTLLPGLMGAMSRNVARGMKSVRLFETGRVFTARDDPEDPRIPFQPVHLAMVLSGSGEDAFAATGLVDLMARVTDRKLELRQESLPGLHPGRGAVVTCGTTEIGMVGELHPAAVRKFGLEGRIAVAEMDLGPLVSGNPPWMLEDVSAYPPMVFDLAFVLADTVPAGRLLEVVEESAGPYLESLELFDEFRGGSIPDAHRSLAVRITLRAMDHTISDGEAAPIGRGIAAAVADRLGGVLRGSI
ncbi:MAG: phenylalanine--tRNA ligase subunit beta [bacterium]|nr:phenylalanine--tRNA ligase subunit beta [bacterium]